MVVWNLVTLNADLIGAFDVIGALGLHADKAMPMRAGGH